MKEEYKNHILISTMDIDGSYIFTCTGPLVNEFDSYERFSHNNDPIKRYKSKIDEKNKEGNNDSINAVKCSMIA